MNNSAVSVELHIYSIELLVKTGKRYYNKDMDNTEAIHISGESVTITRGGSDIMAKVQMNCKVCGKEFMSDSYRIAKGQGIYCSKACFAEFNRGKPFSEERKRKLKEVHNRPDVKKKHAIAARNQLLKIPRGTRATPLETKLCDELRKRKISFLTQQPLLEQYIVDILLRDYPVVIEADGSVHRFPRQMEKDKRRDAEMQEAGYIVLRFPGKAIHHNITACGDKIAEIIRKGVEDGVWESPNLEDFTEVIGDQRGPNNPMFGKDPWNKGLSAETNEKMAQNKAKWKKTMLEKGYWDKWRGKPRVDAPWANLKEDYKRLNSIVLVAELYGVGKTTIYRQLKAQGIEVINKKPRTKTTWENLKEDYERLRSIEKVAKLYGAGKAKVKAKLLEQNIPLQKTWTRHKSD